MARPTEPGYYWLKGRDNWQIVLVESNRENRLYVLYPGMGDFYNDRVDQIADSDWGGKITQEPVTDPPPPF